MSSRHLLTVIVLSFAASLSFAQTFTKPAKPVDTIMRIGSDSTITASPGTASAPGFLFSNSATAGMYSPAADVLGLSTSGVERLRIDNAGSVGIGATAPTARLDVKTAGGGLIANLRLSNDDYVNTIGNGVYISGPRWLNYDMFRLGGVLTANQSNLFFSTYDALDGAVERVRITGDGRWGLNTTTPQSLMHLYYRQADPKGINVRLGDYAALGTMYSSWATVIGSNVKATEGTANSLDTIWYRTDAGGAAIVVDYKQGITFHTALPPTAPLAQTAPPFSSPRMTIAPNGDVTVVGKLMAGQVIGAQYQDVAEWVPAATHMQPGTVVVLNRKHENEVMPSMRAYDTAVAGVVSAQPGVVLGIASDSKAQVATTGRVKVRVDASKGAIAIGDLLVTSDEPGTAMKSQPVEFGGVAMHRPGTVIGKALQPLAAGEGEILVLLSLQ